MLPVIKQLSRLVVVLSVGVLIVVTSIAHAAAPVGNTKFGKSALSRNIGANNTAIGYEAMDPNVACTGVAAPNLCCTGVGRGLCANTDEQQAGKPHVFHRRDTVRFFTTLVLSFRSYFTSRLTDSLPCFNSAASKCKGGKEFVIHARMNISSPIATGSR